MNENLWKKTYFTKNNTPKWPCPTCKIALLELEADTLCSQQTRTSIEDLAIDGFSSELLEYRFIAMFKCSNKDCQDIVCTQGIGTHEDFGGYDHRIDEHIEQYTDVFYPKLFTPPLNLFEIKDKLPPEIKTEIRTAFGLFWYDDSSCANKIRIVVEMLMDDQKIPRTKINPKKPTKTIRIDLDERIKMFGRTNKDISDHLLAIKFIGNFGSHVGEMKRSDVLDALDLLEYSIEKLYDNRDSKIKEKSDRIRLNKGPTKTG